jgi:hypothetical protein
MAMSDQNVTVSKERLSSGCQCGKPKNHCDPCSTEPRTADEPMIDGITPPLALSMADHADRAGYLSVNSKALIVLARHVRDLRASLRREENARKTLAETERRQAAEIARLTDIIDRCAS